MTLRVAHIPYLNAAPFYATLGETPDVELVTVVPRELGRLARKGGLDAGPMAVADYFRQQDQFELLGGLGIAVRRAAESVLLFSKVPREQLTGRSICATEQSSTSWMLMRLLLEERFHQQPAKYEQTSTPNGCDALLLIGDEALTRQPEMTQRLPFVTDLGAAWWEWTLLPFVFAAWVVRKDLPEDEKRRFTQALQVSLAQGMSHVPAIAQRASTTLGLSAKVLESYLANFTYIIDEPERRGMQRFHQLVLERELL